MINIGLKTKCGSGGSYGFKNSKQRGAPIESMRTCSV